MENDNNKQAESEQQGTENVDLHDIITAAYRSPQ